MNGLFITGTDTGIGKTVLSALLLAELRRRGVNAAPMKPVQTGCGSAVAGSGRQAVDNSTSAGPAAPDLDYSLSMAAMTVNADTYGKMSPYRFEPACSPHLASEMAGTEIDLAEIVIAARSLTAEYECVIAEGAGGAVVPLNRRETMLDLMQALRYPVLIAARPGLGTINHTLLTLRALRSDGLDIAGIVFISGTDDQPGFIEEDNEITIGQFGQVRVLGTIPYCPQLTDPDPSFDNLPIPVITAIEMIVNRLRV